MSPYHAGKVSGSRGECDVGCCSWCPFCGELLQGVMGVCRIQAKLTWYQSFLLFADGVDANSERHSFISGPVVLDKSIKFRYCRRKLNTQVLARGMEIESNHLLASAWFCE